MKKLFLSLVALCSVFMLVNTSSASAKSKAKKESVKWTQGVPPELVNKAWITYYKLPNKDINRVQEFIGFKNVLFARVVYYDSQQGNPENYFVNAVFDKPYYTKKGNTYYIANKGTFKNMNFNLNKGVFAKVHLDSSTNITVSLKGQIYNDLIVSGNKYIKTKYTDWVTFPTYTYNEQLSGDSSNNNQTQTTQATTSDQNDQDSTD